MNEFKKYHPIVNFAYFVFVIGFSMFFMHPLCLIISFFCAILYSFVLKGVKGLKGNLLYMLPLILFMSVMNPLVNHAGVTILAYLPSGNPFTLESTAFGICASVMVVTVICWFSCYNLVMTSDKFVYLFGRIIPSLSLVFSMTLRFVPKFINQLKKVTYAQKSMGRDITCGSLKQRGKCALAILSVMVTWALENSIETADSMKARGYGLKGRTAFSIFKFEKRDIRALIFILLLSGCIIFGGITGKIEFIYFPAIKGAEITTNSIGVFVSYFALCVFPVIIEVKEAIRWKVLKSKI